jgi:protein-L-isoaspartate(D-aspartate) O-methyltransferase
MIIQAGLGPGMRVLEVGCDGGHSTSLLAASVGPGGHVVTVGRDEATTDEAAAYLQAAGYRGRVTLVPGDAEHGAPGHAPFDAIIATSGAWDIPIAWAEQLADGGMLVVPVRAHGVLRSVAFRKASGHLVSVSTRTAGPPAVPAQHFSGCD